MNLRICTGFLTQPAAPAYVPPAPGAAAVRKLIFDLHVRDSAGNEFPERCVIEEPTLQKAAEARLIPGAFVLVEAESTARPYERNGVATGGWQRSQIVRRVEFIRVPKNAETAEAATKEDRT